MLTGCQTETMIGLQIERGHPWKCSAGEISKEDESHAGSIVGI